MGDLVSLDRLSEPAVSPDGKSVVFSVRTVMLAKNKTEHRLEVMRLTPGAVATDVPGAVGGISQPVWSIDGRSVLAISDRSGTSQVWRFPVAGGDPVRISNMPSDVGSFRLSADGRHLVLSMAVRPGDGPKPGADGETVASHMSGRVYDRMFVRHWDRWDDGTRSHLFGVTLDTNGVAQGEPVDLMQGMDGDTPSKPFGDNADYAISPDNKTVFFSVRLAGRSEPWSTNFDIYRVPIDGRGAAQDLTGANPAWDAGPVPSPDGRVLAYRAMKRAGFEADRFGVRLLDLATGQSREIDPGWDRSAQSLLWSRDGKRLFVTAEEDGQSKVFAMDVADGAVTPLTQDGHVTVVEPAGDELVLLRDSLQSPAELWTVPQAGGPARQVTHVGEKQLETVQLSPAERFAFAGWNGETVHGYVVKPYGYRTGKTYPVVMLIHGGPQGSFGNDWSYRWNPQFYAGLGYAAVMIDFHGSTGYGQAFTDSISGHWGDRPLEDLQKGWTYVLSHYPFIDGNRACALGASYGGFMVNWIAGNWQAPWKCLVTHDGVFDDRMMGFATDELWFSEWEHGGPDHTPWQDPAAYERFNPAAHVASWRVPQLIIHGERDYRIPVEQGLGAFDALQRRGIESRLLVFPDENHWVLKPANSLQWHQIVAAWLKAHIGPRAGDRAE